IMNDRLRPQPVSLALSLNQAV
ncbi:MAG TPA: cell division protein ZapC, partial [Enterobacteriaceae bacterium]|nr:cell division protein ZapC [Enterobacteriaceae bacterium]